MYPRTQTSNTSPIKKYLDSLTPSQVKTRMIILCLFFLFITIIVAIFLSTSPDNTPRIIITNFSTSDSGIGESKRIDIEHTLARIAKPSNSANYTSQELPTALMRIGTYTEATDKDDITTANFIVDIDDYEQTYIIYAPLNNDDPVITCPSIKLSKYPNTVCQGTDSVTTLDVTIGKYLPYHSDYNGIKYTINQNFDDDQNTYIRFTIDECPDDNTISIIEETAKEWLKSHDLKIEDYSFRTVTLCNDSHSE